MTGGSAPPESCKTARKFAEEVIFRSGNRSEEKPRNPHGSMESAYRIRARRFFGHSVGVLRQLLAKAGPIFGWRNPLVSLKCPAHPFRVFEAEKKWQFR